VVDTYVDSGFNFRIVFRTEKGALFELVVPSEGRTNGFGEPEARIGIGIDRERVLWVRWSARRFLKEVDEMNPELVNGVLESLREVVRVKMYGEFERDTRLSDKLLEHLLDNANRAKEAVREKLLEIAREKMKRKTAMEEARRGFNIWRSVRPGEVREYLDKVLVLLPKESVRTSGSGSPPPDALLVFKIGENGEIWWDYVWSFGTSTTPPDHWRRLYLLVVDRGPAGWVPLEKMRPEFAGLLCRVFEKNFGEVRKMPGRVRGLYLALLARAALG